MEHHLNAIFSAQTTDEVCNALQGALNDLRENGFLSNLPDNYEDLAAGTPEDVQYWRDFMLDDPQSSEEGALKEIHNLYGASLSRLRKLGFHRQPD